jgi:hypothetical protein
MKDRLPHPSLKHRTELDSAGCLSASGRVSLQASSSKPFLLLFPAWIDIDKPGISRGRQVYHNLSLFYLKGF